MRELSGDQNGFMALKPECVICSGCADDTLRVKICRTPSTPDT